MGDKLYLDNNDYDPPYEPTDSEDEYSEGEKEILKEVRKGNKKESDPTQEILAFDESPDEDDDDDDDNNNDDIIGDSDIERGDEYDNIPDDKAWGKQRRAYYNTDFVDQDYSTYNAEEEEAAQQEEEEAKNIQLRLAKELDEADFSLDIPDDAMVEDDTTRSKEAGDRIKLKSDLSEMSQAQRQQLFKKDSPEFFGLIEDFQALLSESEVILDPILEYAKKSDLKLPIIEFAQTRHNMILTYCSNVVFYLFLKSKRISIKNHPITKRLVQLKNLLTQLQQKYDDVVKPQLEKLLERINSGEEVRIQTKPQEKPAAGKKLRMMGAFSNGHNADAEKDTIDEEPINKRVKLSNEGTTDEEGDKDNQEGDEGDTERRGITYQIAKNKGLTPHRKKELRNPRVKHRSKFRKALIRRKGAVRTVRKETTRYGGEMSGIKATVKKGIKIKS